MLKTESSRRSAVEVLFAPLSVLGYMESLEAGSFTFHVAACDENGPVQPFIDGDTVATLMELLQCQEISIDNDVRPVIFEMLPASADARCTPILRVTARRAKAL